MTYQIALNDQEYTKLAAEAAKHGMQPEQLLHDIIDRLQTPPQSNPPVTLREFAEMQYHEGKLTHLPTKEPLPPEMLEALERRAQRYSDGKPASEMVIEDRVAITRRKSGSLCFLRLKPFGCHMRKSKRFSAQKSRGQLQLVR